MSRRWRYFPSAVGGGGGGGGGGSDPLYSNVILLMPLDGADDDGNIPPFNTDFSVKNQVCTVASNAKADDVQAKFGATSLWNLKGNNDAIRCADSTGQTEFTLLKKSFCIEMWIFWATAADRDKLNSESWRRRTFIATLRTGVSPIFSFAYKPFLGSEGLIFEYRTDDDVQRTLFGSTGIMAHNAWHHVCVERDDLNILRLYHNGAVVGSTDIGVQEFYTDTNKICWIGQQENASSSYFNGWIDDVRATLDAERYAGAFTPPTEANPLS